MGKEYMAVLSLWLIMGAACGDPQVSTGDPPSQPDPGSSAGSSSPSNPNPTPGTQPGTDNPTSTTDPGSNEDTGTDDSPGAPDSTQVPADLQSCMTKYMTSGHLPGASSCLVKNQRIAWCGSFGYANIEKQVKVTEHTAFLLASVSKTVTATAMMRLWEAGTFKLDDSINSGLGFVVKNPRNTTPITYRHLLTHSSSIIDDWNLIGTYYYKNIDPPVSLGDTLKAYFSSANQSTIYSANKPGSVDEYSNTGIDLLGYLLEVLTKKDFAEYTRENIFTPLRMKNTSWWLKDFPDRDKLAMPYIWQNSKLTPTGYVTFSDYPSGLLHSSAYDLARFLLTYIQGGTLDGAQVLKRETITEMMKPQFVNVDGSGMSQGLVWFIYNEGGVPSAGHEGSESGAGTQILFRNDGLGLTLLTNGDFDDNAMPGLKNCLLEFAKKL